jgi:acyl-CoA reductase-like NAD-dependent aldehyde dehydrogenase
MRTVVMDVTQQEIAEAYQPLFDLMSNEHGKTLLQSEMDDIIRASNKVQENVTELFKAGTK